MPQPIPSYLIALAVGDLAFQVARPAHGRLGRAERAQGGGVSSSPTSRPWSQSIEKRFGPYRWGRYDILVLPPSFPFGGMENPRLTFATPTILAGDRSLVSLIAHELAHSWSGNLVTNATWRDFWLNEGFTTYLERRIIEDLYGREPRRHGSRPRPGRAARRAEATAGEGPGPARRPDRPRPRRGHDTRSPTKKGPSSCARSSSRSGASGSTTSCATISTTSRSRASPRPISRRS